VQSHVMAKEEDDSLCVVLRVIKADLDSSVKLLERMDPYAVVNWTHRDGTTFEAVRTRTDWNSHLTPTWDHCSPAHPYREGDKIVVQVREADMATSHSIGQAAVTVDELVGDILGTAMSTQQCASSQFFHSTLYRQAQKVGTITMQALLLPKCVTESDLKEYGPIKSVSSTFGKVLTTVSKEMYKTPVQRVEVSGGTAPFFHLELRSPQPGQLVDSFIGKDLSRATDEVGFYETLLEVHEGTHGQGFAMLSEFFCKYQGIFTAQTEDSDSNEKPKELLVLQNLRAGKAQLRMLDVKIGQQTAQAGWQGKSRVAAMRQVFVDGLTNSSGEGYRLEGFDGMPAALRSMDPLLDFGGSAGSEEPSSPNMVHKTITKGHSKASKKCQRLMLQRMNGGEMLMHLLDTHCEPQDPGDDVVKDKLTPAEVSEIVMSQIVARMVRLAMVCRHVPVPQKWIGSSVALGFDVGELPSRNGGEDSVRKSVVVNIFDWGRSEFNSYANHFSLSPAEQEDRVKFWTYYVGGIDRLALEAARKYKHFCNTTGWEKVRLTVTDWDSASQNDIIGRVELSPLKECEETTAVLIDDNGAKVTNFRRIPSTVTYSVRRRIMPGGSRLKEVWQIRLIKAANLPGRDRGQLKATSDPLVEVWGISADKSFTVQRNTTVQIKTCDPVWEEVVDLPVAASEEAMTAALSSAGSNLFDAKLVAVRVEPLMKYNLVSTTGCFGYVSSDGYNAPPNRSTLDNFTKLIDDAAESIVAHLKSPRNSEQAHESELKTKAKMLQELVSPRLAEIRKGEEWAPPDGDQLIPGETLDDRPKTAEKELGATSGQGCAIAPIPMSIDIDPEDQRDVGPPTERPSNIQEGETVCSEKRCTSCKCQ